MFRRPEIERVLIEQAFLLGGLNLRGDAGGRDAGALLQQGGRHAFVQAQRVHHKFKRQIFGGNAFALDGLCRLALHGGQIIVGAAAAGGALDMGGVGNFAVGTGTDAQIIAKLPIIEVVAAGLAGAGKGGSFIVVKAGIGQGLVHGIFNILCGIIMRQAGRRRVAEGRVGLHGEVVGADVACAGGEGGVHILPRRFHILAGQGIHQIDVYPLKQCQRRIDGGQRFMAAVDAAERLQRLIVEALYADRQAGDAGIFKAAKLCFFKRARVGFERDFGLRLQGHERAHAAEQALDGSRLKQAGRAAADKDGFHRSPPNIGQLGLQIKQQRIDIGGFGQIAFGLMGIEIAIRAFAHAPRNVDIKR